MIEVFLERGGPRIAVHSLARNHPPDRFDNACRYALELGTRTYRSLDNILRTGADLADAGTEPETALIDHPNIRGAEYFK